MNKKYIWFVAFLLMITSAMAQSQNITAYEYWFNGDYGTVQTTTVGATTSLTLNETIDVSALDYGLHYISYRFKDDRGIWSIAETQFFSYHLNNTGQTVLKKIVAYEYWFNGDYSTVQTTDITPTTSLALDETIDVSGLDYGLHYVTYRFKDEQNDWSVAQSQLFSYYLNNTGQTVLKKIVACEYWFNGDYSTVQTTDITPTTSLALDENIDVSGLDYGLHYVTYRFKDEQNDWSVAQSQLFSYYGQDDEPTNPNPLITAYRYWIDTDITTLVTTDVASPTATYKLNDHVALPTDISGGQHSITFQFKDNINDWSVPVGGTFSKTYEPRGSITTDANPACKDNSAQFSASTIDVDAITWDFGDGTATETTFSPTHTYTDVGTYSVTAIFTHTPTNKTATATMTMTVKSKTAPIFTQVAAICKGDALAALPTTSNDGVKGKWLPALDNTQTTEYTFTPDAGQCATSTTMTITVNEKTIPTFTQVADICEGDALAALPTTSSNSITGTWSPTLDNTQTTEYTFTPADGECATTTTMTVSVLPVKKNTLEVDICKKDLPYVLGSQNLTTSGTYSETFQAANGCDSIVKLKLTVVSEITPTFTQVAAICKGGNLAPLPITSNNGVIGTWSPALDNTQTTQYTFTPNDTGCTTTATMTVAVNDKTVPTFTQVADICEGDALVALPTTSTNSITGTWTPALDNTQTTEYTFTPANGECATTATMTITVNKKTVPSFTQVASICKGESLEALPTTSENGIQGTWSPALDNTQTTEYTFTPADGECATTTTMTVSVLPVKKNTLEIDICGKDLPYVLGSQNLTTSGTYSETFQAANGCDSIVKLKLTVVSEITPTFTQVAAICKGGNLAPLPITSNNGVIGTWSPALDNTQTTQYTFTPDDTSCTTTAIMIITVNDKTVPTFTQVADICEGDALVALPTTSTNSVTGTWSPDLDNTQTTEYTFTPADGECATTATMTITVNQKTVPSFTQVASICKGESLEALPTTSTNSITGTWTPDLDNTQTTEYTFAPDVGQCATATVMTIDVEPYRYTRKTLAICEGNTPYQLGSQFLVKSGVYTETFQTSTGCDSIVELTLTVDARVQPEFTQIEAVCQGKEINLPESSNNGIYGNWTPAFNPQETTTYTFTPNDTDCAETVDMRVEILPKILPEFAQVTAICEGESLATLPTTSVNGVVGTWSPAPDNTKTKVYTFTPDDAECATTVTMTITVNQKTAPTFTQVAAICEGESLETLPLVSENGISGSWTPPLNNTQTTEYTFTPDAGQCATLTTMVITVHPKQQKAISETICASELPYQFGKQMLTETGVYTETFQAANGCDSIVTLSLEVNELTVPQIKVIAQPDCENTVGYFEIVNYDNRFSYTISPAQDVTMNAENITAPEGTYVLTAIFGDCEEQSTPIVVTAPLSKPTVAATQSITVTLPEVADLTQAAVTEGSSPNLIFTYWLDAAATKQLRNPDAITDSGTYYIKGENAEGCSAIAAVEVTVIKFQPIVVEDDVVEVLFEETLTIDVGANDSFREADGDGDNYSIVAQPLHGTVTEKSDGIFIYEPDAGFIGEDSFSYQLCNSINQCSEGLVKITVKLPKISIGRKINVKELLTPNGDDSNDEWLIKELQLYSLAQIPNKVMLFNRDGLKVYEKENYLFDGKAFKGFGNTGRIDKNELLPQGIYFYVITVEGRKEHTGYLYIIY